MLILIDVVNIFNCKQCRWWLPFVSLTYLKMKNTIKFYIMWLICDLPEKILNILWILVIYNGLGTIVIRYYRYFDRNCNIKLKNYKIIPNKFSFLFSLPLIDPYLLHIFLICVGGIKDLKVWQSRTTRITKLEVI